MPELRSGNLRTLIGLEFRLVIKSWGVWIASLLVFVVGTFGNPMPEVAQEMGSAVVIARFQTSVNIVGGLAALLVSYRAVSYERESGRIMLLGSLPYDRWQIVAAKVLGRTSAISVAVSIAVVAGYVMESFEQGLASPVLLVGFLALSVLYLLATVSIGVGLSAITKSSTPAVGGIMIYYIVFALVWADVVSKTIYSEITGRRINVVYPPPDVGLFLLQRATPSGAYKLLTNWLLGLPNSTASYNSALIQSLPKGRTNALLVSRAFETTPFLLQEPLALLVQLLWGVIPLAAGYLVFQRTDLP